MVKHVFTFALSSILLAAANANATAPEWVDRRIVLSGKPIAGSVDVGTGFGHTEFGFGRGYANGVGFNTEGVLGIASRVDIGLRFGLRVNGESSFVQADGYGHFYEADDVYGNIRGGETFTNPELRARVKLLDLGSFELGIEARTTFPIFPGTRFTAVVGVPMAVHAGRIFKLDFGVYNVVSFYSPLAFAFEVPANFWFQVSHKVFLGPLTALRFYPGSACSDCGRYYNRFDPSVEFALGFGLGVHLAKFADLKTQFIFPEVNHGARYFGVGVGVGFIFE